MYPLFASLRLRLMLLVLLAVLPILGVFIHNAAEERKSVAAEVQSEALRLARFFVNRLEEVDNDAHQLLIALAHVPLVRHAESAACSAFFSDLLEEYPLYVDLNAITPDGEMFCSAVTGTGFRNVVQESYFQRAILSRKFTIGEYQFNPASGESTVVFANPDLDSNGRVQCVTTATFDLNRLSEFAVNSNLPKSATLTIVGVDGKVLYSYPEAHDRVGRTWSDSPRFATQLELGQEGTFETVGTDAVAYLHAFTPLGTDESAVYVSVGIPTATAYAEVNRVLTRNLTILAVASVLALLGAWLGSDVLVLKRVNQLVRTARQLSNGELEVRTGLPPSRGELGQLALAFDEMAAALQHREDESRRAQEVLASYTKRLKTLREIDRAILEVRSPAEVAQDALQRTCELVPCKLAGVAIFEPAAEVASVIVVDADGKPVLEAGSQVPLGPLQGCIKDLQNKELAVVTDQDPGPSHQWPLDENAQTEDLNYSISVPLMFRGSLIGCLRLWSAVRDIAAPEHVEVAREVADMLAIAIQNARLFHTISTHREELRVLAGKLAAAQEAERNQLSRELHDRVGQSLTVLGLHLNVVNNRLSNTVGPEVKDRLQDCQTLVEDTANCIRDVMAELRPPELDDFGLAAALRWYGGRFSRRSGLATEVQCSESIPRLPQAAETALFRIAQEALTNAARHCRGDRVTLTLETTREGVRMTIADNGVGFDPKAVRGPAARNIGWGLLGMRERAQAVGGRLLVESAIGKGTRIIVDLPGPFSM